MWHCRKLKLPKGPSLQICKNPVGLTSDLPKGSSSDTHVQNMVRKPEHGKLWKLCSQAWRKCGSGEHCSQEVTKKFEWFWSNWRQVKGALDKYNIIPQFCSKKVGIFIPLEVLAWVMTACWVSRSRLIYFWRNMNISSIFYFSKSTSINTQYSSLWDTLKMMLFTKYLIKWKRIGRISWNFWYWFNLKSSMELYV